MNARPDPDRPDHAAEDDAWRDLVARLRGGAAGPGEDGPAPAEPSAAERAERAAGSQRGPARDDGAAPASPFDAFDPLGVSRREPEADPGDPGNRGHTAHSRRGREADGADEADEMLPGDFVPEEPAPVLAGADPAVVLAWCGAIGGPVALLLCALLWRGVPGYVIALLIAAFLAGVGTLIMRLPRHKDDGDDGARV